jgi:hypothetical protein
MLATAPAPSAYSGRIVLDGCGLIFLRPMVGNDLAGNAKDEHRKNST